jgi:hypothetical protein
VYRLEQPRECVRAGVALGRRIGGWALVCSHWPAIICAERLRATGGVRGSSPGVKEKEKHARGARPYADG